MRVGQNPNAPAQADLVIQDVALCTVTHIPNTTTAYHSKRLEVVQNSLRSMRAGAQMEATVIVWDNGSIPALRDWLQYEYKPDILILSANVGKNTARTSLARMLKPDTVFCYSDDDMLFYDNWLKPQIELLEHFPNVAAVSGYPVRTAFRWGIDNAIAWADKNAQVETGRFIPQEWEDDFAESVGRTPAWHADYTKGDIDYRVTYKGKQAYLTAHHCQLIARAETIGRLLQYDGLAMGGEKPFDIALDKLGLRLATTQRLCRHMGNVLDEKLKHELAVIGA